jgi:hypothetical protein
VVAVVVAVVAVVAVVTVFTTDTSGLSDDAKKRYFNSGFRYLQLLILALGTPAVDGDTKILTKEEKDAAFNEVLAGVDEKYDYCRRCSSGC